MAAELSARIGKRAQYRNLSWVRPGLRTKDDARMTSEAAAETYATTPAWPQESGYDSDASSVAEEPPALLSRLGTVVSPPRSLLERVGERSPAKPIPFHVSAASSEGPGESLDLNAEPSPNVTDQTMPPTDRHRSSFLKSSVSDVLAQLSAAEIPEEQLGVNPSVEADAQADEFEVPGLSATSNKSFLQPETPQPDLTTESDDAIPGLSSTGGLTSLEIVPGSLPPPTMCVGSEKQPLASPAQEAISSSKITQDQLFGRVRELLTPLILENALLREQGTEGSLAPERKVLADKTQVALGDEGICMSFVKNAIDVHVALIDAGKIKSGEEPRDPRQTGASSNGHPESVGTDDNTMPPRFPIREGEGSIERLPPLYFSMHDDKERQPIQIPPRPLPPPPPAQKSTRSPTPPHSAFPPRDPSRGESRHSGPARHRSPFSASKASGDSRHRGRSRSRSLPRKERHPAQGRFQTRRSRSRSRSKSPPLGRSVTPHRLPSTSISGRTDMARSRSPRRWNRSPGPGPPRTFSSYSRRGGFSPPPPPSASARFSGKVGPSKYPLRHGYRSRSASRSPERYRRRRKDSYSPPTRKKEEYGKKRRRRDSPSPPPQRNRKDYEPRVRSRSREDPASWKQRRRYRSRSRSPGESPSMSPTWRKPPGSPKRDRKFSGHEHDRERRRPSGYAAPRPWEGKQDAGYRPRPYNKYASPFHVRDSASPQPGDPNLARGVAAPVPPTSLHDVRVKGEYMDMQSLPVLAAQLDNEEPEQISSSNATGTGIHKPGLTRPSSSMGDEIPGLAMSKLTKSMLASRVGEEEEEDTKPNVEELERRRLEDLKRVSSTSHPQKEVTLPIVDEGVDVLESQLLPPNAIRVGEEKAEGEVYANIPVQARRKRERSINMRGEQDEDQANKERGKALEAEQEQATGGLDTAGPRSPRRVEDESVAQQGNTEEGEEGSPMIESPQSMESPALPSASEHVLPCHFVPGVWFIQNGSRNMETQDCHFAIDQETAEKWGLASSGATGRKNKLSVQLRCLPAAALWERMHAMEKDASLSEIAGEVAGIPQSWPSLGEMPFVSLHPGEPNEKVWLPNDMRSSDPNDRSKTVQLENHLVVGDNTLRIIQLSPLPAFTFVLYASERSD